MDTSQYRDRIFDLADRARHDHEEFVPPQSPPDEEKAMEYLRSGLGPTIGLYIEARAGDELVRFSSVEMSLLEQAMNDWLSLYAQCYETPLEAEFTVREAAELLIETHNIRDTAQLLTQIPASPSGNTSTNG
jgi:ABC-type uncharacterized transport system involved in gliding motility auxiliary subunit